MENDHAELGLRNTLKKISGGDGGDGSGGTIGCKRANQEERSKRLDFDDKREHLMGGIPDSEPGSSAAGGSGSCGVKVDANLNLVLGGELSSSTMIAMGRDNCDGGTKDKRRKLLSVSRDWPISFTNENLSPVKKEDGLKNVLEPSVEKSDFDINYGAIKMDYLDVWRDLTDDLLHLVFSFLDQDNLCRASRVCRQWRGASSHEDLWRCLNFENHRSISLQQFENMCERYPNATEVNVYGTPAIYRLAMKAVSSLRYLENLTLGRGQFGNSFFQVLPSCHMLRKLTIKDSTLGNGFREVSIFHERLVELHIIKCHVLSITIRCRQLETLCLRHSSMPIAVLNCPLLRELDIASCSQLSDAAIRSIAISCPQLESLDMSNCSSLRDETLREIARACRNLHILDVSYCPNISLESLRLPMLIVLKLHGCDGITSDSMAAIAFSRMLEVLELDNCSLLTSVSLDLPCLKNIRLVNCQKFADLKLHSVLSSITVSDCPSLQSLSITSDALKKLVLQKQICLKVLALQCSSLQEVDLSECLSLTNSICEVFCSRGGCPVVRSLVLDGCKSLTAVSLDSTSLVSLSLHDCSAITSLELRCPYLKHILVDGCNGLERASLLPVGLRTLNLGICPKLKVLNVQAPLMVSLVLKGCGVLSDALIHCPLLTSVDASFCSQINDHCLSATASNCPLVESLVLMSCLSIGPDGLSSLKCLQNLTYLDLSYTHLVDLQPVFNSCLNLKVLKLQACKYLSGSSLEPLYKAGALPALCELDLSYGRHSQSSIEELLAGCVHLTHITLSGCENLHNLDWGSHHDRLSEISFDGSSGHYSSKSALYKDQPNRLLQKLDCVVCPNIKKVVIPATIKCFRLSSVNLSLSSNLKEVDISCFNLLFLNLSHCYSLQVFKLDCPRLKKLLLQHSNIDEEVVEAAIKKCYELETLDVRSCPKISLLSVDTFQKARPSLKRIICNVALAGP